MRTASVALDGTKCSVGAFRSQAVEGAYADAGALSHAEDER
jgi:hypothetical protein